MSKNRGLGRGFDALIPTEVAADIPDSVRPVVAGDAMVEADPAKIIPNPHQPRREFNKEELAGLAESIKKHGIIHPPVVHDTGNGIYELIAGERRVRAAKLAGLKKIPVIVRSFDEQQKLELALLENVQRSELNALETAAAYKKLSDEFNLSLEEIGARMGKAHTTVSNTLRLLNLPAAAQKAIAKGEISEGHGRAILSVKDEKGQLELLSAIVKRGLSVRQAEALAGGVKTGANGSKSVSVKTPELERLGRRLSDAFEAPVVVRPGSKGGKIVISYSSQDDLERITKVISPE